MTAATTAHPRALAPTPACGDSDDHDLTPAQTETLNQLATKEAAVEGKPPDQTNAARLERVFAPSTTGKGSKKKNPKQLEDSYKK